MRLRPHSAFTLIELSIVLVIIGLIVGGVLVGQDLIKGAKIRRVISDVEQIKTAANAYQLKYNGFPGDHSRAEDYFGAAPTNNGNGNKLVTTTLIGSFPNAIDMQAESYLFWNHLSLAGLYPGSYPPLPVSGDTYVPTLGTDMPTTPFEATGYRVVAANSLALGAGNYISLGSKLPADGGFSGPGNANKFWGPGMSAFDARTIDLKIDDGMPTTGRVEGNRLTNEAPLFTCLSGSAYNVVSDTRPNCHVWFRW